MITKLLPSVTLENSILHWEQLSSTYNKPNGDSNPFSLEKRLLRRGSENKI